MQRRKFIRNLGLISLSNGLLAGLPRSLNGAEACCDLHAPALASGKQVTPLKLLQSLSLSEFEGEAEEGPSLVSNGTGGNWLFSLRRRPYPENRELISCFSLIDGEWIEQDPVTADLGEYEAVTASCARGGQPIVAWTSRDKGDWTIQVARKVGKKFEFPKIFRHPRARYINPVLLSSAKDRHWIAWECFENGHFSIFLSKFNNDSWTKPVRISHSGQSLFDPALAEDRDQNLYLAYGITDGPHQNIEMVKINGSTLKSGDPIPVAIGGGLKDRVNLNTKPALAFDRDGRLWISWENNRRTHRLEDGDNFTGDRICAVVCYQNGRIMEPADRGKWLFEGINDHLPTFIRDVHDNLFLATHCGGDFVGNPYWKYRLSWLDPNKGWTEPETIYETSQKGQTSKPALIFDSANSFWLAANPERWFDGKEKEQRFDPGAILVRVSKLELHQFKAPVLKPGPSEIAFKNSTVVEHHPVENFFPMFSGRPRIERKRLNYKGETYTLLLGNLHEHSEISSCWPAGSDGTLHDDYRFGLYSEGYDFSGMTDHGYSLTEVYWRKNLRLAEFYNDPDFYVALPSMEWTLSNRGSIEIGKGVGHKNVIFPSTEEALKFIRNKHEIFSYHCPETKDAVHLWRYLHKEKIDCVTIPHHPADEIHASDWDVHDPHYETVVELFQCRGNAEYPGCPRVINVSRHKPTPNEKAFVDYALRDKGYRMGFIASGDHNNIGVGLAAVWVREVSREGILEALKNRRCFATTGDKIFLDFRVNGAWGGDSTKTTSEPPVISLNVEAVQPIESIEILRDSRVIKRIVPDTEILTYEDSFADLVFPRSAPGPYYYLRITQKNQHMAWSSPVWLDS